MKVIRRIFVCQRITLISILASCLLVACSSDGDGTDPFGGGGNALIGKWTSISATGTVGFTNSTLGNSLANAINNSMTTYNLTNVVHLQFDANGRVALYDMGTLYDQGTFSLKGNNLVLTNDQNQTLNMNISLNGNEFTLNASATDIAALVAWAIGDAVLSTNGYGGMVEAGLQVAAADLTIKFQKQQ